jgi:hypothetical protein
MKDDYYTFICISKECNAYHVPCFFIFTIFIVKDSTATGTVYLDDNLSFEYRDSMRYNYVSLVSYGNIIVYSSIDDSDSQGFDLKIEEVITVIPETSYDGNN